MADPIVRVVRDYGERRAQPGRGSTPNGTVHFSDRPVPGAQQVELAGRAGSWLAGAARRTAAARGRRSRCSRRAVPGHRHREPGRARNALEHRHDAERAGALPARTATRVIATTWCSMGSAATSTRRARASRCPMSSAARIRCRSSSSIRRARKLMRSPSRTFFVQQTSVQNPNSANARPRAGAN